MDLKKTTTYETVLVDKTKNCLQFLMETYFAQLDSGEIELGEDHSIENIKKDVRQHVENISGQLQPVTLKLLIKDQLLPYYKERDGEYDPEIEDYKLESEFDTLGFVEVNIKYIESLLKLVISNPTVMNTIKEQNPDVPEENMKKFVTLVLDTFGQLREKGSDLMMEKFDSDTEYQNYIKKVLEERPTLTAADFHLTLALKDWFDKHLDVLDKLTRYCKMYCEIYQDLVRSTQ